MDSDGRKVFRIVGGIFAPMGLLLLGIAAWSGNRQSTILKHWPTVDAQVTSSRVNRGRDGDGKSMFTTEIEFRYVVSGKEYRTPSSSPYSSSSYTEMKKTADTYAAGTTHSIRYNPADPNDIRFDVGYNFGFFFLPILLGAMGLVFAGVGSGLLFAARNAQQLLCPSCGQRVEKGQNFCPHCATSLPTESSSA